MGSFIMIVADLKNSEQQTSMTPFMQKAVVFLRQSNVDELPDGTVEIDGRRVFAIIQRYETLSTGEPKFEYHQKYIDMQFIVSGEEIIGWVPRDRMKITEPYDSERDICFGVAASRDMSLIHLQAGQLAVLYPEDGHAPKLAAGAPSPVMKIVVKVAV
jgi:biofilm protein TabA